MTEIAQNQSYKSDYFNCDILLQSLTLINDWLVLINDWQNSYF